MGLQNYSLLLLYTSLTSTFSKFKFRLLEDATVISVTHFYAPFPTTTILNPSYQMAHLDRLEPSLYLFFLTHLLGTHHTRRRQDALSDTLEACFRQTLLSKALARSVRTPLAYVTCGTWLSLYCSFNYYFVILILLEHRTHVFLQPFEDPFDHCAFLSHG